MSTNAALLPLRAQLESDRDALVRQLRELGAGDDSLEFDSNFADTSQVTAERGELDVLVASLKETLADIEHAILKFDTNTYGLCENCGAFIPETRLEAMPTARLCINCASKR